jgi:hypothetical protein
MPIKLEWHDEENGILVERFSATWTSDEYFKMLDEENALLAQRGETVHVIVDASKSNIYPADFIKVVLYGIRNMSPHIGISVFIVPMTAMRRVIETSIPVIPGLRASVFFRDTVEEAVAMIQQRLESPTSDEE